MSNSDRVQEWRKRTKAKLVDICGGKCNLCGYAKCSSALEFHHLDPSSKDFGVASTGITRNLASILHEVQKCIMLCANCHREVHSGAVANDLLEASRTYDGVKAHYYLVEVDATRRAAWAVTKAKQQYQRDRIAQWKLKHPDADYRIKKVDWSKHDVFRLLDEHSSYEAVGRLLGVTGAAVRRRAKYLSSK